MKRRHHARATACLAALVTIVALALGGCAAGVGTGGPGGDLIREGRYSEAVTLLADPRQAQELVLAQELGGTLTLALRSPQDAGTVIDLGLLDQLGLLKVPTPVIPRPEPFAPLFREFRGGS